MTTCSSLILSVLILKFPIKDKKKQGNTSSNGAPLKDQVLIFPKPIRFLEIVETAYFFLSGNTELEHVRNWRHDDFVVRGAFLKAKAGYISSPSRHARRSRSLTRNIVKFANAAMANRTKLSRRSASDEDPPSSVLGFTKGAILKIVLKDFMSGSLLICSYFPP